MSISTRIKELRDSKNMNQSAFAQKIGASQAAISRYERGDRAPDSDFLRSLVDVFDVNLTWLLTGRGEMYIDTHAPARDSRDSISIPVYAEIAAGKGIEAEEIEPSQHVSVSREHLADYPGPFYAFEVKGSSMEPEMRSGDIVVVAGWDYTYDYNGHLCAFRSVDGLLVKRLFYDTTAKCLYLIPINPTNPITKHDENSADLTLIGVVVVLMRNYTKGDKS